MKDFLILLYCFVCFSVIQVYAQNKVAYEYDMAGNRISRRIVVLSAPESVKQRPQADSTVVGDQLNAQEIKIYPNPTRGILKIELTGIKSETTTQLRLFSGSGIVLISKEAMNGINELDLSSYAKGWYILRIISGEMQREYKVIKE